MLEVMSKDAFRDAKKARGMYWDIRRIFEATAGINQAKRTINQIHQDSEKIRQDIKAKNIDKIAHLETKFRTSDLDRVINDPRLIKYSNTNILRSINSKTDPDQQDHVDLVTTNDLPANQQMDVKDVGPLGCGIPGSTPPLLAP